MFGNHFITNFPQNAPVKKNLRIGQYFTKIWTKLCGLLFWATLYYITTPLSTLISSLSLNHHSYADDTQLFLIPSSQL